MAELPDYQAAQAHKVAAVIALVIEKTLPAAVAQADPDGPRFATVEATVGGERFFITVEQVI